MPMGRSKLDMGSDNRKQREGKSAVEAGLCSPFFLMYILAWSAC